MKEDNKAVSDKTKEPKKTSEKKTYKLRDEVKYKGGDYKVVEVLEDEKVHLKNLNSPRSSFIVSESEIG